jgi:hypothetical protein
MRLHNAGLRIEVKSPHFLQQHRLGDDTALALQKELQQLELLRLKLDPAAATAYLAGQQIHFQIGKRQIGPDLGHGRAPHDGAEPRQQLGEGKWLDQIIIGTRFEPFDPVVDAAHRGKEDDRRTHVRSMQGFHDAQSIHAGEHAIDHQRIIFPAGGQKQTIASIIGMFRVVAMFTQTAAYEIGSILIIFDQKQLHFALLFERIVPATRSNYTGEIRSGKVRDPYNFVIGTPCFRLTPVVPCEPPSLAQESEMTVHTEERPIGRVASHALPKKFTIGRHERSWGRNLAALATDVGFALWRIRHRNASFAQFYAHLIAARLARGGAYKTLATRRYWTGLSPLGAPLLDPAEFRKRGRKEFDWFLRRNLRRDMTCIDYGCGNLRIGQHFIDYLDSGRYLGLDIIDSFYRDSLTMLDGKIIARSQPRFLVISDETLQRASAARADLIFATTVIRHVPPQELTMFFGNVIGLMHETSVAIVHYKTALVSARIGATAWAHSPVSLISAIACVDPQMHVRIEDAADKTGARHRREALIFSRSAAMLHEWLGQSSAADARESEGLSVFTGERAQTEAPLHGLIA